MELIERVLSEGLRDWREVEGLRVGWWTGSEESWKVEGDNVKRK